MPTMARIRRKSALLEVLVGGDVCEMPAILSMIGRGVAPCGEPPMNSRVLVRGSGVALVECVRFQVAGCAGNQTRIFACPWHLRIVIDMDANSGGGR